jgi:hypothetical protein
MLSLDLLMLSAEAAPCMSCVSEADVSRRLASGEPMPLPRDSSFSLDFFDTARGLLLGKAGTLCRADHIGSSHIDCLTRKAPWANLT